MKKSSTFQWVLRVLIYIAGLFCMALGVAFSANSELGISPVNSLPYVVSEIVHVAPGTCVTLIFCLYILLQFLILRKDFKPINLLQILFSTVFGYCVTLAKFVVGDFSIPTYAGKLTMLCISIFFVALGITLYIEVDLVPMSMEGLSLALADKLNVPFPTMKVTIDCVVVIIGVALSFLFLHRLVYIREGTVITAVVAGKVVAVIKQRLSPVLQRICFGSRKSQDPLG